jgi:uncharacterized protein YndB with AHSA1/START domain
MEHNTFDVGPPGDVTAHETEGRWTLLFTRVLRHPPEKVWTALTDPAHLAKWGPFTTDRDLGHTGDATFTMTEGDISDEQPAFVTRAEAPSLLEYTWGDDRLRWELAAVDGGTRLTLHHTVHGPEWLSKVAAGWHICFVVAEHLLDGDEIGPITGQNARNYGWDQLNDAYAERLTT